MHRPSRGAHLTEEHEQQGSAPVQVEGSTNMATGTKTKGKTSKTEKASKPAPAVVEAVEEELEELAEDETSDKAPSGGGKQEVTFGASDLAKHLSEGREKPVTAREIRTLIRKMARDGKGRVTREIRPDNRTRYNWSGLEDPEVVAIIAAFNAGELEADKQEKLQALKERKAKQTAEKKAAAEAAGDDEAEDDEVLEDEDGEE